MRVFVDGLTYLFAALLLLFGSVWLVWRIAVFFCNKAWERVSR